MDRHDLGTALSASLPILATLVAERVFGPTMDALFQSPLGFVLVLAVSVGVAAIWVRVNRPSRSELQVAFDKIIDYIYVLPPAAKPPRSISTEGIVQEHAPHNVRRDWYLKLGLPEPKPHRSQYR